MTDPLRVIKMIKMTRGASTAVATALGISRAAVSQWASAGHIPAARIDEVRQALDAYLRAHDGAGPPDADAMPAPDVR
jgi:DNA-binding transcriptional regulator YdaS (Cro superfamily)